MEQIEIKISNDEINYEEAVLFMESRVDDISKNKILLQAINVFLAMLITFLLL